MILWQNHSHLLALAVKGSFYIVYVPPQPRGGFCPSGQMEGLLSASSAAVAHPSMTSPGVHGYSTAQGIPCIKTPPKITDGPCGNIINPSGKPPGFALERSLLIVKATPDAWEE